MTTPSDPAFEGSVDLDEGRAVVHCHGEVDMAAAEALGALVDRAMAASPDIVVDMTHVTFLDSSGLRVLVVAQVNSVGSVTIRNPSAQVEKVLQLSGVDRVFSIENETAARSDTTASSDH